MLLHSCGHGDCFTCPFKDCIVDGVEPDEITSRLTGRKLTMTNNERVEKKRKQAREYYRKHRQKVLEKKKQEYREKTTA